MRVSGMQAQGRRAPVANEGQRVGDFVLLQDVDGQTYGVLASAVVALCDTEEGSVLVLPGGRVIQVRHSMATVLRWLQAE